MTIRSRWPLVIVGLCVVGAVALVQSQSQSALRTAWDSYRAKQYTPSEDQHLTDPALLGAIDLHAHSDPDVFPRQWDGFDVARLAKERGLRGVLIKNHYTETASLAYLARKYATPGFDVFGGLALNAPVGGLNVQAIRYMVDVSGGYGRIVWMPTHDAEHEVTYSKEDRPFVRVSKDGKLLPEVLDVLKLIAQDDLTLGTGHVSAEEALMIIREAKALGVKRIILTHPVLAPQYTFMNSDQLREAASLGAYLEIVSTNLIQAAADRDRAIAAIRLVGPGQSFVASDVGLTGRPNYTDALAQAAKLLRAAGFSESDLNKMFKENPARLIKLPV